MLNFKSFSDSSNWELHKSAKNKLGLTKLSLLKSTLRQHSLHETLIQVVLDLINEFWVESKLITDGIAQLGRNKPEVYSFELIGKEFERMRYFLSFFKSEQFKSE